MINVTERQACEAILFNLQRRIIKGNEFHKLHNSLMEFTAIKYQHQRFRKAVD